MKNDLKISTLTIICVLCTAVSGAYGASSVRSFGGSGTYASASDAAAANTSSATSVSSVRGGSVRVNPGSGVSGSSTTIEAGTTTNGRVATTPRLSIGHYLGGGTSISGGSSLRPQTPGSSGGSSSGGDGGLDPDVAAGLRQQVDQLQRDVEDLRNADDNINDQLLDKQDALIPGDDGYIIIDDATNEIFVDVDALQGALETVAGKDGREVELGSNDTHLLWRYVGDNDWYELIAKADITGPQGEKGEKGDPGEAANLDAYSTTEQMNQAIGNAIAALADVYATKAELANYATTDDLSLGLAAKANAADVYTKAEVYNKTEVDDKVADIVAGDVDEALANKADKTYVDSQLANKADKTELAGYATVESVSALDSEMDEVNATATDAALGAAQALSGLTGKEDTSNKTQTLTNSATQYPSGAAVTSALAGKADKTELENYVTSDELAGKADQSALDSLTGRVSANEAGISELNTTMGSGELTTTDKTVLGAINELKTKTDGMATDGNFEEMNNKITEMEGKLDGKQDVANMAQTVTDDETKYPSSAAVYGELETKANVSDLANYATTETVNQIEQNVTNVTQKVDEITNPDTGLASQVTNITNVIGDEDSGLVKDVADVAAAADAAQQTATDAKNTADAAQTTADEAKAGLDAKEDKSNKAASITAENQSSATAYPTVGAVTQWTNDRINELSTEGLPVNPDNIGAGAITTEKIADNAVTEDKLSDELNAEIDAKANADDLGALATKDQIANADVADDAAIAKSKLALDVQTALDKAENAVSTDGAAENSVLGTDGEGNPVWYEIAM